MLAALVTTLFALIAGPSEPAGPLMSVWTEELTVCEAPAPNPAPRALCIDADGIVDRRCVESGAEGVPSSGPQRLKRSPDLLALVPTDAADAPLASVAPPDDASRPHRGHLPRIHRPPRA